jgi:Ca-activated chloride channel family protein
MNDKSIEARLARVTAPDPDPEARLRAKRAALEEFARVHAASQNAATPSESQPKGLWGALRLFRDDSSHGSTSMAWFVRRNLFAGVAGACVVGLGIVMVRPVFLGFGDSRLPGDVRPPVAVELQPAAPDNPRPAELSKSPEPTPSGRVVPESRQAPPAATVAGSDETHISPQEMDQELNAVVASGMQESLQAAMEAKREQVTIADSITAEDIARFPDRNVAESLQRVEGVQAARPPLAAKQAAASEQLEEVSVTGMRASRARQTPHKGVASPAVDAGRMAGNVYMPPAPPPPGVGAVTRESSLGIPDEGRDKFQQFDVNPVKQVADEPVSTFSADVDTASYSFVRRQLNSGRLPQKDSVRVEEMVNYFDYAWPAATSAKVPFKPTVVVSDSPWGKGRKLVHIGVKGFEISREDAPGVNLVLLLDVSGSMNSPDKLPLAVQSMELLLSSLKPADTVGIVVYAGAAGTVLEPTPVKDRQKIITALRELRSGGSTAGAEGIERAYQLAEAHFRKGGINRILLATDGDFNVGIANTNELKGFVERKREKGIFLSVLGFGQGNYRDELAQALAQNGNGVAAYIDTLGEAQKVLVQEAGASLFTIAKDVKLQVEFNPLTVAEYRLVGYETRALKREDFNNDAVDAGDVGSGHTVTAIYEITPTDSTARMVDKSRYAQEPPAAKGNASEYGFLKIRYKLPESDTSQLIEQPILIASREVAQGVLRDVQFATAVAGFGQLLRGGTFTGPLNYDDIIKQAQAAKGDDPFGYRTEFVQLVRKAKVAREM